MAPNALTTSMSPKFALFRDLGVGGRGAPKSWTLSAPHSAPPILGVPAFSQHSRKKEKDLDRGHRKRGKFQQLHMLAMHMQDCLLATLGGGRNFGSRVGLETQSPLPRVHRSGAMLPTGS